MTSILEECVYQTRHWNNPSVIGLTPEKWAQLEQELKQHSNNVQPPFTSMEELTIYGWPIAVIHFDDDPLYKQLCAMAALVGADVLYQSHHHDVLSASFRTSSGGWKFIPASQLFKGSSSLVPTDEHGLPLRDAA